MKNLITAVLVGLSMLFFAACWSSGEEGEVEQTSEQQQEDKQEETRLKIQKVEDAAAIPKFEVNEKFQALVKDKEWAAIKKFIKKKAYLGGDVNMRDKSGRTPLFYAIKNSDLAMIKKLIKAKADINAQTLKEGTPIFSAIDLLWGKDEMHNSYARSMDILNYLLSKKPDLEKRMFNDKLAACVACPEGITPLHYAVYTGSDAVVKKLARRKADVNAVNKYGQTPLHFAAIFGNIPIMEALILRKADVNAHDKVGMTPLHHTVKWGKVEATQLLIKKRAHLIAKDRRGRTPLHFMFDNYSSANEFQKLAILQMLMQSKANVYMRDKTNVSFMNVAQKMHKRLKGTEMAGYLKRKVFIQKPSKRQVSYIVYDTKGKANYVYEDVPEKDQAESEWTETASTTSSSGEDTKTYQFDPSKAVVETVPTRATTTTVTPKKNKYGISDSYSVDNVGNKKYEDGTVSSGQTTQGIQYGISSDTYKKNTPGVYSTSSSSTYSSTSSRSSAPTNYGISNDTYKGGSNGVYNSGGSSSSYSSGTYRSTTSSRSYNSSPSRSGIQYGISDGNSMSKSSYSSGSSSISRSYTAPSSSPVIRSSPTTTRSSSPTVIRSSTTTTRKATTTPAPSKLPTYNNPLPAKTIIEPDNDYLDDEPVYDEEFEETGDDR